MTPAAHRIREALLALLVCLLLTALFTWPWRPNPHTIPTTFTGEYEFYPFIDGTQWTYMYAWSARHPLSFYDPPQLLPITHTFTLSDPRLTEGILFLPFFRFLAPVTALGWSLWLSVAITSWTSYLSGRWLGWSRWGAAAFTILFGFGLNHAAHIFNPDLAFQPFLPLAMAGLWHFGRAPCRRSAVIAGALLALASIEYSYYAVMFFTIVPLSLGILCLARRLDPRPTLLLLGVMAALTVIMLIPVAREYWSMHRCLGIERGLIDCDGIRLSNWIMTPSCTLIVPGGPPATLAWPMFPGLVTLVLGLTGLPALRRQSPLVLLCGLFALFLSFGTGRLMLWQLGLPAVPWPLPYELLHHWLMPFRALRAPMRFVVLPHLVLALSGALTVERLAPHRSRWRGLFLILLALSFCEARWNMHGVDLGIDRAADPAYAWIAAQPAPGGVLDLPMGSMDDPARMKIEYAALLPSLVHGRRTPNGTAGAPVAWQESIAAHTARPRPGETPELLRVLGIRFVVARDGATIATWKRIGLRRVFDSPTGSAVFEVDSPQAFPSSPTEAQDRLAESAHHHATDLHGLDAVITCDTSPSVPPGWFTRFPIVVRNTGTETWCANGAIYGCGPRGDIMVGAFRMRGGAAEDALDPRGWPLIWHGSLPADVAPGETVTVTVMGLAPREPGVYTLDLDLHAFELGWFHPPDSHPCPVTLRVEAH